MEAESNPFAVTEPPPRVAQEMSASALEDRVLGLRRKVDYFYQNMRRNKAEADAAVSAQRTMIADMIATCDGFEAVLKMFDNNRKLRKQDDVLAAFRTTYEGVLHALEKQGVHPVPIVGKTYRTVEFAGCNIPEPWSVVDARGRQGGENVVREVVRSLWVLKRGNQVHVLRRAQVMY